MKFLLPSLLVFFIGIASLAAQPDLGPSIGIGELPDDAEPICTIPLAMEDFDHIGPEVGSLIPEFNLYDRNGNELIMSELLAEGKPVLMVAGSYTCWVFRDRVDVINQLVQDHGDELTVIVIYTLEAHPIEDISPYYGFVNPGNVNLALDITYEQPETYGERKQLLEEMLNDLEVDAEIYLDGPCNSWWETFGPAPNNAYLIDTDGTVLTKHGWFHKHPENIYCDLNEELGLDTNCEPGSGNGYFGLETDGGFIAEGPAGTTISITIEIVNNSNAGAEIEIQRITENLPANWSNAICTDVCYPPDVETATIYLEADTSMHYTHYFYTADDPGQGEVKVRFRNTQDPQNEQVLTFRAQTYLSTAVGKTPTGNRSLAIYPQPAAAGNVLNLEIPGIEALEFQLFDAAGQLVRQHIIHPANPILPTAALTPGMYFYRARTGMGTTYTGRLILGR